MLSFLEEIVNLRKEIFDMKEDFAARISELEKQLDREKKIQEMFKMRVNDEQKARYVIS